MKLTFRRLELNLAHTWSIARYAGTTVAKTVLVELTGADGTVGLGEAAPSARYKESADSVKSFLNKVDPRGLSFSDVGGSMHYLEAISRHDMAAKCALNLALLAGAGKRAKKPLYDLLGLGFRENQHITSFTIGIAREFGGGGPRGAGLLLQFQHPPLSRLRSPGRHAQGLCGELRPPGNLG